MGRLFLMTVVLPVLVCCSGVNPRNDAFPPAASIPLVTFVFDDGNDTDYLVAKEIFAEQGSVACAAITTGFINSKDHMTPAQIIGLQDAGWEIMSHTVSHPNLRSLTPSEVEAELSQAKAALEGMGLTITNLVYPYNKSNEMVRAIAGRYYRSGRGGTNSFNAGSIDPYFLKSFSTKHDLARMESYINSAYADKSWLIFYQHEIDAQVKLADKQGTFMQGETLRLSPSGTVARYVTVHWFPVYGFSMYLVPFSGAPETGDTVTGVVSGATARVERVIYNERAQITEMLSYIRTNYPDMRIVTIDQGLDLLGIPKRRASAEKRNSEAIN